MSRFAVLLLCLALCLTGCRHEMADQAALRPLAEEPFFSDGAGSRPIPAHTVPHGVWHEDASYLTGKRGAEFVLESPIAITPASLTRGRERYDIYCSVCHGLTGEGRGMVAQRGFPAPPSLHEERLRTAPLGHFFFVITNGFGVMYPYASRVPVEDRWAIAGYVRALQLSQHATLAEVPVEARAALEGEP